VDQCVEANIFLAGGGLGAGGVLGVASISAYLIDCSHSYLFYRTKPILKFKPPGNAGDTDAHGNKPRRGPRSRLAGNGYPI
jgi:hypothetical protein